MINYKSTRGKDSKLYTFSEAILQGIASDGGLLIPDSIPTLVPDDMEKLVHATYQERAHRILDLFQTDLSSNIIRRIVDQAYTTNFDTSYIAPVVILKDNQYLLELWHGPTAAFKDMALQIMPLFFSEAAKKTKKHYLILVATSGDTGKAALEGYKNKKEISIAVFYPHNKVSMLQHLQIATQEGSNVKVCAVNGNFDDTQTLVKKVFADKQFADRLGKSNVILSSANSINWGRLLPQIIYHISAYLDLVKTRVLTLGDPIDIVVPTGNFGNLLAAYYAKQMALPIRKLICASNTNNVLTQFLTTGVYDISQRNLVQTPSPSMDILLASNIERLLFLLTQDSQKVAGWMTDLQNNKQFSVDEKTKKQLQQEFVADWVSNKESLDTIKQIASQTNYLMDTHTAVAQRVGERYLANTSNHIPLLICATAHWSKFVKDIYPLFVDKSEKKIGNEFAMLSYVAQKMHSPVPQNILSLKHKAVRFDQVCEADKLEVEKLLITFIHSQTASL